MSWFVIGSSVGVALVVVLGAWLRSRTYATFRLVGLSLHTLLASAMLARLHYLAPVFIYLHAVVFIHSLALIRPRLRGLAYRAFISVPAALFGTGTLLALPWVVVGLFGVALPAPWLPYALALVGVVQSLTMREEEVHVAIADGHVAGLRRHASAAPRVERPLRLVQITDPHLGPFMSVERLRAITESAV